MKYIFVSGPYTSDPEGNTRMAIVFADTIRDMGFIPFVPHLYHYWDKQFNHSYDYWTQLDMAWLDKCDAVYRIPGYSKGADDEVEYAQRQGKPIFRDIGTLKQYGDRIKGS